MVPMVRRASRTALLIRSVKLEFSAAPRDEENTLA
jgi:hypothetical protein